MVDHLIAKGYKRSEIYGTTWGDAGKTPVALVDMKCSYVKQIRYVSFYKKRYATNTHKYIHLCILVYKFMIKIEKNVDVCNLSTSNL